MYYEIELNRKWLYDYDDEDVIGERNFVIPAEYFYGLMEMFGMIDTDTTFTFLDWYDPETDGELIYEFALRDDAIVEEGDHYYSRPNLHI